MIVFDKTGALTIGQPRVVDAVAAPDVSADDILRVAAAVDAGADHPLALAIVEHAEGMGLPAMTGLLDIEGEGASVGGGGRGRRDER